MDPFWETLLLRNFRILVCIAFSLSSIGLGQGIEIQYNESLDKEGKPMNQKVAKLKREMDAKRRQRTYDRTPEKIKQRVRSDGRPIYDIKHDEEREDTVYSFDHDSKGLYEPKQKQEPLFRKDTFFMQILASICLFLGVSILFHTNATFLEVPKQYIQTSFQEEFEFDQVAIWYEEMFGRPIALLPTQMETVAPGDMDSEEEQLEQFALPATGKIRESFEENGRGIYVETEMEESVEAVKSGLVRFIGEDEEGEWGKVVVVRHYDGGESWYGMLDDIHVNLYDYVDSGEVLASVSPNDEESVGVYYFALKEGDSFIDPIEVITLD